VKCGFVVVSVLVVLTVSSPDEQEWLGDCVSEIPYAVPVGPNRIVPLVGFE
jgi:hypothetical protein